jgi:hypothetical protein
MGVSAILLPFYCGILRLSILTVNYNAYLNYLYPKYLKSFEELLLENIYDVFKLG